jgi:hypothetical protein
VGCTGSGGVYERLTSCLESLVTDRSANFLELRIGEVRILGILRSSAKLCKSVFLRLAWHGDDAELL